MGKVQKGKGDGGAVVLVISTMDGGQRNNSAILKL